MVGKIRELLIAREQSASEKVLQMLWSGDDAAAVLDFALKNNLKVDAIEQLAEKVEAVKGIFARGNAVKLEELQRAYDLASKKYDEAKERERLADEALGDASIVFVDANDALKAGQSAIREALDVLSQGIVPKGMKLSSGIAKVMAADAKQAENAQAAKVLRDEISTLQQEIQALRVKAGEQNEREGDFTYSEDGTSLSDIEKSIAQKRDLIAKKTATAAALGR